MKRHIRATYRIQLTSEFRFAELACVLPYLARLGISHLYLSPIFRSRAGSTHGYDVTRHSEINPELGGEEGFRTLARQAHAFGLGIVLDIVPNHMAVMTDDNAWWMDVLEHGAASRHADYFDIDWLPARASMRHRLLVPVLGAPLGEEIGRDAVRLHFDAAAGEFALCYGSLRFPVDPRSCASILATVIDMHGPAALNPCAAAELAALQSEFQALPAAIPCSCALAEQRLADARALKHRLKVACQATAALAPHIAASITRAFSGTDAEGADRLAALLARQPYRLAFWRVSGEEINYRRFFDVNDLAALRVEDERVFAAVHGLVQRLWREGVIDGLRVDHADGLHAPAEYFARLRSLLRNGSDNASWVVAEKILGDGERLPSAWDVDGTTGYEFASQVTAWLMHGGGAVSLQKIHARFVRTRPAFAEIAYRSRRQVMRRALAAEISGLATRLDRLAQRHRDTADFTLFDLREAIVEVLAHFPVYRTYIADGEVSAEDRQYIVRALGAARGRKRAGGRELDFLQRVLLGELTQEPVRAAEALQFTLKFQQVAAPVMAKGIEDTACYRHASLLAMNEVGADPTCRGIDTAAFHRANEARARERPRSMLASSTHDTKRGEDARHRLCVLTEMPEAWSLALGRWRRLKSRGREPGVDPEQQYLLLQSLLAIWPLHAPDAAEFADLRQRLQQYSVKAAREAKEHTSWLEPDAAFEEELQRFVGVLLPEPPAPGFEQYFEPLLARIACFGVMNAWSATVLKLTSPGVPDIYQGNELPALVLVDPDNRRAVDFAGHDRVLDLIVQSISERGLQATVAALLAGWHDGRLKMFLTWRLLGLRAIHPELFECADYLPVEVQGSLAGHLCAYVRRSGADCMLVVVSRCGVAALSRRPGCRRLDFPHGREPACGFHRTSAAGPVRGRTDGSAAGCSRRRRGTGGRCGVAGSSRQRPAVRDGGRSSRLSCCRARERLLVSTTSLRPKQRAVVAFLRCEAAVLHGKQTRAHPCFAPRSQLYEEISMQSPSRQPAARARAARTAGTAIQDAIALLKADHRQVEEWFAQFENARSDDKKALLAQPDLRRPARAYADRGGNLLSGVPGSDRRRGHAPRSRNRARQREELISQIEASGPSDGYFDARVKVLSEMIKHHVKEEEQRDGMFAKAKASDMDLQAIGAQLGQRKAELELGSAPQQ